MEFVAIWPVLLDRFGEPIKPVEELFAEAARDLPMLTRRHRVLITGKPSYSFERGAFVPGAAGAKYIVRARAPFKEVARPRKDGRPFPKCAVDLTP